MLSYQEQLWQGLYAARIHMASFDEFENIMQTIKALIKDGKSYDDILKLSDGFEEYALMRYFLSMYENYYRFILE